MGNEQAHAVESALVRIIEHLLKLQHSPAEAPRNGWRRSVRNARTDLARRLKRNPALASERALADSLASAWPDGRRLAVEAMRDEGEEDAADAVPEECPYRVAEVVGMGWWPGG